MAEVVLFHHALGLTDGVRALADAVRAGGHTVHTPDLFDGQRPDSIDAGLAVVRTMGEEFDARADRAVADLPQSLVYAGFSIGEAVAQRLAQTRPGARGALLYESCLPVSGDFAVGPWPDGLPAQVHGGQDDEFFAEDLPAARELVETAGAELFLYPGTAHLFTDSSVAAYDDGATAAVLERSTAFLDRLG